MTNNRQSNNPDPKPEASPPSEGSFWAELKRRKVMRVAITYAVMAWLIIQIAVATFEGFGIPVWAFRFVVIMLLCFFPVALIITWAFELTPEGIKTTKNARADRGEAVAAPEMQNRRNWTSLVFAAALPTLIFGALATFFYFRSGDDGSAEKSIAVLPLENLSSDEENAFFADGVQEDILTNLSRIDELLVISRSSTLRYDTRDRNLKQIGTELGVRYLVEGSVRRADDRVRVTVQLIDAHTDEHLWAENFDRSLNDVFALQSEIAKNIASQLRAVITPEAQALIEYRPTEDQKAYDAYLQARKFIETSPLLGEEKIASLKKAVQLDPEFSEAWALLASESIFWWQRTGGTNDELLADARLALSTAEHQIPGAPDALYARGQLLRRVDGDQNGAINVWQSILSIHPDYYDAHWGLSLIYRDLMRLSEAKFHLESMQRTDPLSNRVNTALLSVYRGLHLWDNARALARMNLDRGGEGEAAWQRRLADLHYLENGDRGAYAEQLRRIPEAMENPVIQFRVAILERDYETASQLLETLQGRSSIEIESRISLEFRADESMAALLRFEQEGSKWVDQTGRIRSLIREQLQVEGGSLLELSQSAIWGALIGGKSDAETLIDRARTFSDTPLNKAESELYIAIAYIVMGEHDKAIDSIEAAWAQESPLFINRELEFWFMFDRLRGNPRFDALMK